MSAKRFPIDDARQIDTELKLDEEELRQFFRLDVFLGQLPLKPGLENNFDYLWMEEFQAIALVYVGNGRIIKFKLESIHSRTNVGFSGTLAADVKPNGVDWQRLLGYEKLGYIFGFSSRLDEHFAWRWSTELRVFVLLYQGQDPVVKYKLGTKPRGLLSTKTIEQSSSEQASRQSLPPPTQPPLPTPATPAKRAAPVDESFTHTWPATKKTLLSCSLSGTTPAFGVPGSLGDTGAQSQKQ